VKITIDTEKENLVSTAFVAKALGLSEDWVRQLDDSGYLESRRVGRLRKYDFFPTLEMYHEYMRMKEKSQDNLDDESRKLKAEADWKEAKAEIEQMHRDEIKGQLHSSDDVMKITNNLVMAVRAEVLSLPGQLAVDCAETATAQEAAGIIKAACNDILNNLCNYEYDPAKYAALVKERERWMNAEEKEEGKEE